MEKYNWREIEERLTQAIHPNVSAVAMKFVKTEDELEKIRNVVFWPKDASVCKIIGLSAYWHKTVALRAAHLNFHCGGNCGTCERGEDWHEGKYLRDVRKWFTPEAAKAHAQAQLADVPTTDHIAIVTSPMYSGDIAEPDVIILSTDPGSAFYLFSGLIQRDFRELTFKFRGESSCVETWCHTYVTGEPGITLGCRGDRGGGALSAKDIRYTMTPEDLIKALDGCDEMIERDSLIFPFYPGDMVEWDKL